MATLDIGLPVYNGEKCPAGSAWFGLAADSGGADDLTGDDVAPAKEGAAQGRAPRQALAAAGECLPGA